MSTRKTVIFLGDGMADEPLAELQGKTPLEFAKTPAMDSIARDGSSGTLLTLPEGYPTSSEVANMSVLGSDLASEYCGRGPMEAAGRGIPLGPDDTAFRVNLTTVTEGRLTDFSGGHIPQPDADELIAALNRDLGSESVRFHTGVSYRNLLVLSGAAYSPAIKTDKPDDNHGQLIADHLPAAISPEAEPTAELLRHLIQAAPAVFDNTPLNQRLRAEGKTVANAIWPWSGGRAGALKTLNEKYGISSAVISAVDVIVGLGHLLGMEVITVPGATGYIDTNYEGKADAAIEALKNHDLVYVHVEAIDEVSHAQDLKLKVDTIEQFDSRVVGRVLNAVGSDVTAVVLPDHPVPTALGKHTRTPVPVAIRRANVQPDAVATYGERTALNGALGSMVGPDLMNLLFG